MSNSIDRRTLLAGVAAASAFGSAGTALAQGAAALLAQADQAERFLV